MSPVRLDGMRLTIISGYFVFLILCHEYQLSRDCFDVKFCFKARGLETGATCLALSFVVWFNMYGM